MVTELEHSIFGFEHTVTETSSTQSVKFPEFSHCAVLPTQSRLAIITNFCSRKKKQEKIAKIGMQRKKEENHSSRLAWTVVRTD